MRIMVIGCSGMLGMDMSNLSQSLDFDVAGNTLNEFKGKHNTVSLINAN
ncbi:MAG: hypothetical protein ACUZ8H_07630 [Candidatus Anammoxibacter sp.]